MFPAVDPDDVRALTALHRLRDRAAGVTEAWLEGPLAGFADGLASRVRDRPTWIAYVQLAFWAWFLYAFGATQALLRDEQGTTRAIASLHGTAWPWAAWSAR